MTFDDGFADNDNGDDGVDDGFDHLLPRFRGHIEDKEGWERNDIKWS